MLNSFLALPLIARYAIVLVTGVLLAQFANWAIYNWAYHVRNFGPWSAPLKGFGPRTWRDRLPILGWWRLRRELAQKGNWFWIRPLVIECVFPLGVLWLYHFESHGGTVPLGRALRNLQPEIHGQFLSQLILISLMTIATFIDFDEQSIPDIITVPGTLIGLLGAALVPGWFPLFIERNFGFLAKHTELHLYAPRPWKTWLDGPWGLGFALAIVIVWCFAILDRRWITRRGWSKAIQYLVATIFRRPWWIVVAIVGLTLFASVSFTWYQGIERWKYLLSSLMGLACAGGLTWGVRRAASWGLGVEALGFGDVTLMAMIGTYVGWQPSLLIFFFAPMMAVLIVVAQWLLTGEKAAPYGPYLCAATVVVLVFWVDVWSNWAEPVFELGAIIVPIMGACVVLMGAMLWIWRLLVGRPRVDGR